jgi:hypothetical protein
MDSETRILWFLTGLAPVLGRHAATTAELADGRACRGRGAEKLQEENVVR